MKVTTRSQDHSIWSNLPFSEFLRYWDFRPRTSWFQHFITINNNGGDADIEAAVLHDVGSYGYQLGRILDAVSVLVDRLEADTGSDGLSEPKCQALANFRQVASDVDASVAGYWSRR